MVLIFSRKPYRGDHGMDLVADVGFPTAGAEDVKLIVQRPSGSGAELDAEPAGENTVSLKVPEEALSEAGTYKAQVRLTIGEWTGHSDVGSFEVGEPIVPQG